MAEIFCTQCGTKNQDGARFCASCGSTLQLPTPPLPPVEAGKSAASRDFITLSCPNCGGKLEVTADIDRFACQHCGAEHLVKRQGGLVSLAPVVEGIQRVESKFNSILNGSEKSAAEQTIQRLKSEISEIENKIKEKEGFITNHKPAHGVFFGGLVYIALAIIIFTPVYKIVLSIKGYDFLPWLLLSIPIGFFFTGIRMLTGHASNTRAQKQVKATQSEVENLKANLEQRQKQLEDLHQFTIKR